MDATFVYLHSTSMQQHQVALTEPGLIADLLSESSHLPLRLVFQERETLAIKRRCHRLLSCCYS